MVTGSFDARSIYSPRRQPFLYLAAALIGGILVGRHWHGHVAIAAAAALISFSISIFLTIRRRRTAATALLLVSFACAGLLLTIADRESVAPNRVRRLFDQSALNFDQPVSLTGSLKRPPEPAPDAVYLDIEATEVDAAGRSLRATGLIRLMLPLESSEADQTLDQLQLGCGAKLRVLVRLQRAQTFKNPGSPDFDESLSLKGYDLRGVIKSPLLIERLSPGPVNSPLGRLYELRLYAMRAVDARFTEPVAGTLKAMLFGNRYFMDSEVMEKLRAGSTFHVLSISGMHVGILAWVLV